MIEHQGAFDGGAGGGFTLREGGGVFRASSGGAASAIGNKTSIFFIKALWSVLMVAWRPRWLLTLYRSKSARG